MFLNFQINPCAYVQTEFVEGEEHDHSITSRINLIDLAGSERCNSAQTSGDRLRVRTSTQKSDYNQQLQYGHYVIFIFFVIFVGVSVNVIV